jgi:signal transduction histidine kinase
MGRSGEQRGDVERGRRDCAEQVADAARTAARAERQRLVRDLHDSVTQSLISLQLSAQAAAELWDTQPAQAREALDQVRHLAAGAAMEMRAVLVDLHDAVLEQQGLVAALEVHSAVVRQRSGLQVEVRVGQAGAGTGEGPPVPPARLPAAYEEALYRLVQEALANVVKHARATHATVTLTWDPTVRVSVEDNGVGFGAPVPAFAYGLAGMRERVAALGGRLSLENRPAGGTRVVADLPRPDDPGRRAARASVLDAETVPGTKETEQCQPVP